MVTEPVSLSLADEMRIVIIYLVTAIPDRTVKEARLERLRCSVNKRFPPSYTSMFSLTSLLT